MTDAVVESLHVYPVKGCRGIDVASADVAVTGLAAAGVGDREWMIVDGHGRFVTQREYPQLALVATSAGAGAVTLTAPGRAPLLIDAICAGTMREVVVWRSTVRAFDAGDPAAAWLSAHLGADVRLVRFDRGATRPCNPDYAGDSGAHTLFADGYPLLVAGAASLADLNARVSARGLPPLPMNRFRPNVVLAGLPAYDEDHLDTIAVGGVVLRCVKPCTRCRVTTTDQATAQIGEEPLRTLAGYRMDARFDGVTFGVNAIVVAGDRGSSSGTPAEVTYRF